MRTLTNISGKVIQFDIEGTTYTMDQGGTLTLNDIQYNLVYNYIDNLSKRSMIAISAHSEDGILDDPYEINQYVSEAIITQSSKAVSQALVNTDLSEAMSLARVAKSIGLSGENDASEANSIGLLAESLGTLAESLARI